MDAKKCMAGLIAFAMLVLAGGCSNGLNGRYGDASGETQYEFSSDGQAVITILNIKVAAEYSLDDDKIIITSPQGTVVLKQKGEMLYGPMGLELSKI